MASILISSSEKYSGKSAVCIGLGTILKRKGYTVGYMKPIGNLLVDINGVLADEDAEEMRRIFELTDPIEAITPILLTENLTHDALMGVEKELDNKLNDAFSTVSEGKDLVLIEGAGGIGGGAMYNLSDPEVASKLNTNILLITRYDSVFAVDRILCDFKTIDDSDMIAGVILNEVPDSEYEKVTELVVPFLENKGITVFGVIPQDATLRSVTISDIIEDLHGEVLAGADHLDNLVEHYFVGAMEVNSAIKYFRRAPNSAVITGGDRSDIQLAAIEAKVRCLVLTGNLRPSEAVLGSAEQADIPVVLVRGDTMSTIERVEHLIGRARIKQDMKLNRIVELIENNIDVESLTKAIGL
ncbi:MAG: phosphotransacetylase family protein [Desulfobacterales bacterium]|nr:phosphotransacetylase family protein [Desulfobacterales bacterium]